MTKRAILEQRMNCLCQAHSAGLSEEISETNPFSQGSLESNSIFTVGEPLSCIISCRDPFWEPTISNLGHSYRKLRNFEEAIVCYEVALRLCPSNASNYTSLGLTKQFLGDVDGAIDLYHRALSIKSDDNLAGEMLTRALRESLCRPEKSASDEEMLGISTMDLTSGVHHSLGSSIPSRHTGRAPLLSGDIMSRQSHPPQRSIVGLTDDFNISFATGASDMDTRNS
jgi:tetratricopeptide (TPR) repeat protein